MKNDVAKSLDDCLKRIKNGETMEECLAAYPSLKGQIEPLLRSAQVISYLPKMEISEQYRETAAGRLMSRIQQNTARQKVVDLYDHTIFKDNLARIARWLHQSFTGNRRIVIPVTLIAIIAIVAGIGVPSLSSPSSVLASGCTLSIYSGEVDILSPGQEEIQPGIDGMTLEVGTRIITAADSQALITFFDGSTLNLEPQTDIEIERLVSGDEQSINIVLKQYIGKTWSRVIKMADPHYEIQTPSAAAVVRGTIFMVEVDETGETIVATNEGLVSVIGEDEEVFVPAGFETNVKKGATPAFPFKTLPTQADHQLPDNAVAPPFNGELPDNAIAPPFNGDLPDNANPPPFDGDLPDNANPPPFDGDLPDNANPPPFDGDLPDNANPPPFDGDLPDNANPPPFDGDLPDNANPPPFDGDLPGNANPLPFD
jgi:hypothetical protein